MARLPRLLGRLLLQRLLLQRLGLLWLLVLRRLQLRLQWLLRVLGRLRLLGVLQLVLGRLLLGVLLLGGRCGEQLLRLLWLQRVLWRGAFPAGGLGRRSAG